MDSAYRLSRFEPSRGNTSFISLLSFFFFPLKYHSLYLANLQISPSRSAYHHHIPIPIFVQDFLDIPFSFCSFLSFLKHTTAYTSPTCISFLRGQPIMITFLLPSFLVVFGFSFGLYFWLLRILYFFFP